MPLKIASLRSGGRDGTLIVVDRALEKAVAVPRIAPTLQSALENWEQVLPELRSVYRLLNEDHLPAAFPLDCKHLASPLPRAYQWLDGSAYLHHVRLVRKARGAEFPPELETDPLMYQGGSDGFLGPCDPIPAASEDWGIDFEAEVAVVTADVPMGVRPEHASTCIRLVMLVNDVSLRALVQTEIPKGFGFVQSKPASAFSPVAVTPDELGEAWDGRRVRLPIVSHVNGELIGNPNAGEDMAFDFPTLIAHAAKTRALSAGTIVGSGTVSNRDASCGSSCLVERRMREILERGKAVTPYLRFGDRVRIEMVDREGRSVFGAIDQEVVRYGGVQ